jgi:hypothetical protein
MSPLEEFALAVGAVSGAMLIVCIICEVRSVLREWRD